MSRKLNNYLRTYRRRASLSQDEVAFLLGCRSGSKASRYERFARAPNLETVFMYEIMFGTPARELFRGIFQKVEKEVIKRARMLSEKLEQEGQDRTVSRKLSTLGAISSSRKPDTMLHEYSSHK